MKAAWCDLLAFADLEEGEQGHVVVVVVVGPNQAAETPARANAEKGIRLLGIAAVAETMTNCSPMRLSLLAYCRSEALIHTAIDQGDPGTAGKLQIHAGNSL